MIRQATIDDIPRIAEIEVIGCRYAYSNIVSEEILYRDTIVQNRIKNYENWLKDKIFSIYVYEDENKIIKGMMGIGKTFDEDKSDSFELHFIYVEAFYCRNGIGKVMLDFFEQKGIELGYKEFVIWVLEENQIGRKFYEKNNYHIEGSTKIFQRYGKKEIRYIKKIL